MYGSPARSKDLNLPFPTATFKQGKEESDLNHPNHQHHQMSSGILRYRSAPSTLLGDVCEEFLPHRSSSPEAESMFARFMGPPDPRDHLSEKHSTAVAGGSSGQRSSQFGPAMDQEASEVAPPLPPQSGPFPSSTLQMLFHSSPPPQQQPQMSSMAAEQEQAKSGGGSSNLLRQSSSPAGLFSHLNIDNGFAMVRGMGGFRPGSGSNAESAPGASSRLKGQISFSSRQGSRMSQISEIGSESVGGDGSCPEEGGPGNGISGGGRSFMPGYAGASWEDSVFLSENFSGGAKRGRDASEAQNGDVRNLSHQFSLPKNSSEMSPMEKFLQFQDAVPCKIRAKRGCATHPRSIAERVRRTKISERMRKLQELVPNMDKQTNTADMLDLAVDYIKDLQKTVKTLAADRASCTCSSKHKP